jgi:hypothetical protein
MSGQVRAGVDAGWAAELLRKKGEYYLLAQMDREQPSRPEGDSE